MYFQDSGVLISKSVFFEEVQDIKFEFSKELYELAQGSVSLGFFDL